MRGLLKLVDIADAISEETAADFELAKEEFSAAYTLEDLWDMS